MAVDKGVQVASGPQSGLVTVMHALHQEGERVHDTASQMMSGNLHRCTLGEGETPGDESAQGLDGDAERNQG